MSSFAHHPDGVITVANARFPLAFFVAQEPAYTLPAGMKGRIYEAGVLDILITTKGEQVAGEGNPVTKIWAEGDGYIAKVNDYITAYDIATAPSTAETEERKRVLLRAALADEFSRRLGLAFPLYKKATDINDAITALTGRDLDTYDVTTTDKWA